MGFEDVSIFISKIGEYVSNNMLDVILYLSIVGIIVFVISHIYKEKQLLGGV